MLAAVSTGNQTGNQGRMPYHEFYKDDFEPREHYRPLWEHIRKTGQSTLAAKAHESHLALRTEGVTFTVYGDNDEGIERVWPFDLLPRIIPPAEWAVIEGGLKQRVRALNLFLKDIYHNQRILKDGVIPVHLIFQGKDFRREIMDIDPPQDIYTHISGIDLIRDETGRYLVLEDNLRTPSGVSYMIENRVIERRILPEFFAQYRVRRVEHYPALLLQALRHLSPRGKDDAEIVLLTPGIYNSAYFEHTFLAKEMGIELVESGDLVVTNNIVYMKTTHGLRRVDVVYRRVDDVFLDPLVFRAGLRRRRGRDHQRLARRQRRHRQRPGQRHRRRQGHLSVRPRHHSLLPRRATHPRQRADVSDDPPRRHGVRPRQPRAAGRQGRERIGRLRHADGTDLDAGVARRVRHAHPREPAQLHRAAGGAAVAPRLLPRWRVGSRATSICAPTSSTAKTSRWSPAA